MHVSEARTRDVEPHRFSAGREQERVVVMSAAVSELDVPACGIDLRHPRFELQVDVLFAVELR